MTDSNFAFLSEHDPVFLRLAVSAEKTFSADPNTTLIKLRQLGEALAQELATRVGIEFDSQTTHRHLLDQLNRRINLDSTVRDFFHTLRIEGNKATHQFQTSHKQASDGLKIARALAVWYHQSFGVAGSGFKPGKFILPKDPSADLRCLQVEIEQLKATLLEANQQAEKSLELAALKDQ